MLAITCPGQGSQTPGFLAPWLELPGVADRLHWLSTVAAIDLAAHGTTSDEETIKDTAVAQPLIVASGLLALLALGVHRVHRRLRLLRRHMRYFSPAALTAGVVGSASDGSVWPKSLCVNDFGANAQSRP